MLTGILICLQPSSKALKKQIPLRQVLSNIKGWKVKVIPLDEKIVGFLSLDDYVNQKCTKGDKTVLLYVGYYVTADKLAAVHDPLVCFPGQGWIISDSEKRTLKIGKDDLHFSRMIVTKGQEKDLILYWFQAFDKTSPGTFLQKIYALWAMIKYAKEDNSFVRISTSVDGQSTEKAFNTGVEFIEAFCPRFLEYVKQSSQPRK